MDVVSDLFTRIRNAQMMRKKSVMSPVSSERLNILKVLLNEGYIKAYDLVEDGTAFKKVEIELKYDGNEPVITEIKRVSKPGRRVYTSVKDIKPVKNGLGINILSTNKGILSETEARKQSVGGELICTVF